MIVKTVNGLSASAHNKYGLQCLQNNGDTIKVEREIRLLPHAVDTLIEGDVANNKRDLPLSPVCPLVKCETEVSCVLCPIYSRTLLRSLSRDQRIRDFLSRKSY
jgi:hypothetical protein